MVRVFLKLTLAAVLAAGFPIEQWAQGAASEAAAARAREAVEMLSTGDRTKLRQFITANYTDEALKMPMEQRLNVLSSIYDTSRGFEIHGVQESTADSVTLLVRNKLTGAWSGIFVGVEAQAPHKIRGIGFRPGKAPANMAGGPIDEKGIPRELEEYLKKLATADVFSGAVLLAKDGKPVFSGAYGIANKDFNAANRLDTKFNVGSMNKMFTGIAIAQLVEKGKLAYDDPLSKFVPDFPDAESAKKIQIKHLLTHTAGLGGYFTKRYQDMSRAKLRSVDDMMALARQDEKLLFEPGTKWQYSNSGMLVLGKVIEIVSGKSYFDYIAENITVPAGMANTGCFELDRVNTNLAVGYEKQFSDKGVTWTNNIFEHVMRGGPQGGCFSTAEDLLRFDQALRSGKLISAASFRTVASAKPEVNSPNYGYGFQVKSMGSIVGHSGGFPGISANLDMHLESGWTAIVLSNYGSGTQLVGPKLSEMIGRAQSSKAAALNK